jgi:hypothetical protein
MRNIDTVSNYPASGKRSSSIPKNVRNPYLSVRDTLDHCTENTFLPSFFNAGRKLHHSPFLDDYSKWHNSSLELHTDLEALRPLILS